MSEVIEVEDFDTLKDLIDSEDRLVVKFWATWCGPCRQYAPHFEKVAEYSRRTDALDHTTFVAVDVDTVPDAMLDYGFRSVPTTLVFEHGELTKTITGAKTAPLLVAELSRS